MPEQPHYIKDRTCTDGKPCSGEVFAAQYGKKWRCRRCKEPFAGYIVEQAKPEPKPSTRRK